MGISFPLLVLANVVGAAFYSFDDLSHRILRFSAPYYNNYSIFTPAAGPDPFEVARVLRSLPRVGTNARNVNDFSAAFLGLIVMDLLDLGIGNDTWSGNVTLCNPYKDSCCLGTNQWIQTRLSTFQGEGGSVLNRGNGLLDLTFLYGATNATASSLRGPRGKLRTDTSRAHLPSDNTTKFVTGDFRINEHPMFAAVATVFMREHNRLATSAARLHPDWTDDQLYQDARRWNIAFWQKVVYYEYLGADMGGALGGTPTLYDPSTSVHVTETFVIAAKAIPTFFSDIVLRLDAFGNEVPNRHVLLYDVTLNAFDIIDGDADSVLRGMLMQAPPRAIGFPRLIPAVPGSFFYRGDNVVASIILEGRDIGLRRLREFVTSLEGSSAAKVSLPSSWDALVGRGAVSTTLQTMYGNITDGDPIVVLLAAALGAGSNINSLLSLAIRSQLQRARDGDPNYFEHTGVFTAAELETIYSTHLTEVLKRNVAIFNVPVQAFFRKPAAEVVDGAAITEDYGGFSAKHGQYSFSEVPHPHFKLSWNLISGSDGSPHIQFFMEAKTLGWVGFGLGLTGPHAMLDTDMVYATVLGPNVSITDRHSLAFTMPQLDTRLNGTDDLYDKGAAEVNGATQVWFSRALAASEVHDRPILETEMAYAYAFNSFGSDSGYHGPSRGVARTQFVRKPVSKSQSLVLSLEVLTSLLLVIFFLLAAFVVRHKHVVVVKAASPLFCLYILLGAALACSAVFPLTTSSARCGSSLWLLCMGLSMMLAAIFVKNLRLAAIFASVNLRKQYSNRSLQMMVFLLSAVPFFVLVLMEIVDPPVLKNVAHPTILYALKAQCIQTNSSVWIGLLVCYFAALLGFGLHIASSLWSVKYEAFNEAGGIILALNQFAVLGIVVVPALLVLDFSDDVLLGIQAGVLMFGTAFTVAALFAWKVWIVFRKLQGSELAVSKDSTHSVDITHTKASPFRTTGGSTAFIPRTSHIHARRTSRHEHSDKDKNHSGHNHSHDRPDLTPSPATSQLGGDELSIHKSQAASEMTSTTSKRSAAAEILIITTDADLESPPASAVAPLQLALTDDPLEHLQKATSADCLPVPSLGGSNPLYQPVGDA